MDDFGQNIKKLFNLCVDLPKAQQKAQIEAADYDEEIKAKVRSMLSHEHVNYGLTSAMIEEVTDDLGLEPLKVHDTLNEFELLKLLGHGGQGEVWLAKRTDPEFEQLVAIKVLKPVHSKTELNRFQAERNLLATLSHPNIAQLYGGGTHQDGRLYMVLEYIDGSSLCEYIDNHQLSLTARLDLFLQVTEAVKFAHQNGIIHRDIKPSNIWVDQSGQVKLLDFGIAKHIDADITESINAQMLTMAYSSPEQLTGKRVSTVTDIYALGLVLYEILTGKKAQVNEVSTPAEIINEVTEKDPTPPSQCVEYNLEFNSQLKGDLDNLVLMALRKEPNQRYQTVDALIYDIKQYLTGRPLKASGETWYYKAKKLVRRNPLSSSLALIALVTALAIPVIILQAKTQVEQQRDVALVAQKEAEKQAALATQTKDFLVTILRSASPLGSEGRDIALSDVLELGERQLLNSSDNQPDLKATLIQTLASIQYNLGHYDKAMSYWQLSVDMAREYNFKKIELTGLGQIAIVKMWLAKLDEVEALFEEADKVYLQVSDIKAKAWHLARKATWLQETGKQQESESVSQQGLKLLADNNIKDDSVDGARLYGRFYNELTAAYRHRDNNKALSYINQALDYALLAFGQNHPKYQTRLISKSVTLMRLNRNDEAEKTLKLALSIAQKLFTDENPKLASIYAELATYYHNTGYFQQALNSYTKAQDINTQAIGKNTADYAVSLNNLAYLHEDMGNYDEALKLFSESLAVRQKVLKNQPMRIASVQGNLARLHVKLGHLNTATELLQQVIPVYADAQRNNLYNHVIEVVMQLKAECQTGLIELQNLLPEIQKQDKKSWRKMHTLIWISQELEQCGYSTIANQLSTEAMEMLGGIYSQDSEGYNKFKMLLSE